MVTHGIIPIHEIAKILEPEPVFLVSIKPFFDFAICLGMLDPGYDMFYAIIIEEF